MVLKKLVKTISRTLIRAVCDRRLAEKDLGSEPHILVVRWDNKLGDAIVKLPFAGQQHKEWLQIHHNLRPTEHHQTESTLKEGFNDDAGPHMKRRKWHSMLLSFIDDTICRMKPVTFRVESVCHVGNVHESA